MTTATLTLPRKLTATGRPVRAGGEKRGNSTDRRNRKLWMLSPGAGFGGDGATVACVHCSAALDYTTVEADRKIPGGSYARHNVQPACSPCNKSRSNKIEWTR